MPSPSPATTPGDPRKGCILLTSSNSRLSRELNLPVVLSEASRGGAAAGGKGGRGVLLKITPRHRYCRSDRHQQAEAVTCSIPGRAPLIGHVTVGGAESRPPPPVCQPHSLVPPGPASAWAEPPIGGRG